MTKKQAIAIITKSAKQYHQYLEGNQVVFVYHDEYNHPSYTAVRFRSHNFLHFTGVIPKHGMNANGFYRAALNSRLSEDIRSIVPKPPGKIYAILKKPINAPLYTKLTYKAKNISITKKYLPKELLEEIDDSLFEGNDNEQV